MADRLFDFLPPQDVGDPQAFLDATGAILAGYPIEVMMRAVPEIVTRSDRPTLKLIKAVCEEFYAPIQRQIERARATDSHRLALPAPRQRTPEEQLRAEAQVEDLRRNLGIPLDGLPPKQVVLPPSADMPITADVPFIRNDGKHARRVLADLQRRKGSATICDND